MLILSENTISIDHIMWQPTAQCSSKCRGCYIGNASKVSEYRGPLQTEILDLLFGTDEKKLECEQFTLSLDDFMVSPHQELISVVKDLLARELPFNLWVTLHDSNSLTKWITKLNLSLEQFLTPLTGLSLSSLPVQGKNALTLREACDKANTLLVFNKVVKEDLAGNKGFEIGCRYANLVHLILQKPPLGKEIDPQALDRWNKAFLIAKKINKTVVTDMCLTDCYEHVYRGKSCSAGFTKIAVWPNGNVTACPYDTHFVADIVNREIQEEKETWNKILRIIAEHTEPIDFCSISRAVRTADMCCEKEQNSTSNSLAPNEGTS